MVACHRRVGAGRLAALAAVAEGGGMAFLMAVIGAALPAFRIASQSPVAALSSR